jgi:hypothetical protein
VGGIPHGHTVAILAGLQISIAVLGRSAAFEASGGRLRDCWLGASYQIWSKIWVSKLGSSGAAAGRADARSGCDGVCPKARARWVLVHALVAGGKAHCVPLGFRAAGLMVPDGSMMRPFPIAPLDIVWTGWTEYIPAGREGRGQGVVASAGSRRGGQWGACWGGLGWVLWMLGDGQLLLWCLVLGVQHATEC